MEQERIRKLLEGVQTGRVDVEEAVLKLREAPYVDLGFAKLDTHRKLRQGVSEVIYGAGKTGEQILEIAQKLLETGEKTVLITRMTGEKADYVTKALGERIAVYEPLSGTCIVGYGANFGGLSALLSMLNSCASGVSVVNIDNGFGAGYQASLINHI
ncbi:MAG: hypothetical protein K2O32_09565 [Acetatifactor sp.]|nr:hypothetical protein [Acetatifactor sp.]